MKKDHVEMGQVFNSCPLVRLRIDVSFSKLNICPNPPANRIGGFLGFPLSIRNFWIHFALMQFPLIIFCAIFYVRYYSRYFLIAEIYSFYL